MKEATKGRQKAAEIVLSKTEAESVFRQMADMLKHVVSVPKSEVDRREQAYKKKQTKSKR